MAKYFFTSTEDESNFIKDIVNSPELDQLFANFFPEIFLTSIKLISDSNRAKTTVAVDDYQNIELNNETSLRDGFFILLKMI